MNAAEPGFDPAPAARRLAPLWRDGRRIKALPPDECPADPGQGYAVQRRLVEITPRHGMRVAAVSPADMRDIYDVLTSLEPTAAELLTRRGLPAAALAPLFEACAAMEAALGAADRKAWAAADEAFHLGLARLCGNRRLAGMVMQVWEQSHRARMFTLHLRPLPERSTAEHRAVLEAILAGDGDAARETYRRHRARSGDELINLIERSGVAWL